MTHKVHPKIFKIRETKDWMSRGFTKKNFAPYLEEDVRIRDFVSSKLPQGIVECVEIERTQSVTKVIIKTARPALIIGRGGKGAEDLSNEFGKILRKVEKKYKLIQPAKEIKLEILEVKNMWSSGSLVAQWVAGQLEKMVPFRRVLKMAISKAMESKEVQGIKIEISGRLNGAEIARREWLKEGRLPRQSLRAIVDYGFAKAHCTYGVIGVKAWLYKGDQF